MYLKSLSLTNFRNYASQTFEVGPGVVLLLGDNAQGKTNILEAIFLLATASAPAR
jgi:DNA replication and repair protein RecF